MRIEDSKTVKGRKKVVLDPGEADGLDPEVLIDYADEQGALFLFEGEGYGYIIQFPDEEETIWKADLIEDALNMHAGV